MRICCSSWSFRREMPRHQSIFDFPAWCGSVGIRELEVQASHLPAQDGHFVEEFRRACTHAGVSIACLALDTDFTHPDAGKRFAQVERTRAMLHDIAAPLGIPVVRVNMGMADMSPESDQRALETLRELVPDLQETGVAIALENCVHLPEILEAIVKGVPTPLFGSCPDICTLSTAHGYERLTQLAPSARHVHATSHAFDQRGWETTVDYRQALAILKEFGYDGTISIRYAGEGAPADGVLKTKTLIERLWNFPEQAMAA